MHLETRSNDALCRDLRSDGMRLNTEMNMLYARHRSAESQRNALDRQLVTLRGDLAEVARDITQLARPSRPTMRPGIFGVVPGGIQLLHLKNQENSLKSQIAAVSAQRLTAIRAMNDFMSEITRKEREQADIGTRRAALGCGD
ncbi:hypothetical protein [Pyruvatibacter sp.]|uniref:hypothetical protein n=1 Tax=Pyruvatibacter sp. TaxID=1981328 RepID=UPI0032EFFD6A